MNIFISINQLVYYDREFNTLGINIQNIVNQSKWHKESTGSFLLTLGQNKRSDSAIPFYFYVSVDKCQY